MKYCLQVASLGFLLQLFNIFCIYFFTSYYKIMKILYLTADTWLHGVAVGSSQKEELNTFRSEALTAVSMKRLSSRVVVPCSLVEVY
jgi:hypothetical protein